MTTNSLELRRQYTLEEQSASIRSVFGKFKVHRNGSSLVAIGDVQPSSFSVKYKLRVDYALGETPKVHVLSPVVRPRTPGGAVPHVYPGNRLCLFAPGEWSSKMQIARTVIPWAIEWLFFYEAWHATGEWLGGGIEHDGSKPE